MICRKLILKSSYLCSPLLRMHKLGSWTERSGGAVRITTRENEEQIELCVIDDGVGFDISKMEEQSDGRQHIGVRKRKNPGFKRCAMEL